MGKGSAPRPFAVSQDEYGAEWGRIFGKHGNAESQSDGLKGRDMADLLLMGRAQVLNRASNTRNEGAIPSASATYVRNDTGEEVTEDWWPDPMSAPHAAVEGADCG